MGAALTRGINPSLGGGILGLYVWGVTNGNLSGGGMVVTSMTP